MTELESLSRRRRDIPAMYEKLCSLRCVAAADLPHRDAFEMSSEEVTAAVLENADDVEAHFALACVLMTKAVYDPDALFGEMASDRRSALGAFDYNKLLTELFVVYPAGSSREALAVLDRLMTFMSCCMVFPYVPVEMIDCKNCVLCCAETDHSLQAANKRFSGKVCNHVFDVHHGFTDIPQFTVQDFVPVDYDISLACGAADPLSTSAAAAHFVKPDPRFGQLVAGGFCLATAPSADPAARPTRAAGALGEGDNFDAVLNGLKRDGDIRRTVDAIKANLEGLNAAAADYHSFVAPKNVSFFALDMIRSFWKGVHRRGRWTEILAGGERPSREPPAASAVEMFRHKLSASTDANSKSKIVDLFYGISLPYNFKYSARYKMQAARVMWFKNMEAQGYGCETLSVFIDYVTQLPMSTVIGQRADSVADPPTGAPPRVMDTLWVAANVCAFLTMWNTVSVHQADDPCVRDDAQGLFVFNGAVGYRHRAADGNCGRVVEFDRLFELLYDYDVLLARI
uniref:Allo64 n=1 Tax=Herpesvirus DDDp TaxID=3051972 RepID=A0A9Y1YQJ1_9VIRU|nr:allo64 [Herpesvirus DDDp]